MNTGFLNRAISAYYRTGGPNMQQPSNSSEEVEYNGKYYVVLRNVNGILAVYRITNTGQLKRLKRWPKALDE
ncbi:MAG: hypothetical protein HPY50_00515 [Firmicutes bacterium]|nr:hypothetical protein [Bacillota bacterium]